MPKGCFLLAGAVRTGSPMVPSQHAGSTARLACHYGWPLVRAAFSAIIEPTIVSCVGPGCPLVMVCEADLSRLLDDLRLACSDSHPRRVMLLDGRELGTALREGDDASATHLIQELSGMHLVIVRGIDLVGGSDTQHAVTGLLDALATAGVTVCVSLTRPPGWTGLDLALASRLAAGLVLHVPCPSAAVRRDTATSDRWSVGRIVRATASRHGLTAGDLVGPKRTRSMVHGRNLAMYLARRLTGRSLDWIGAVFGGRDHTTVMRGIRSVETRRQADAAFAGDIENLVSEVSSPRGRRPVGRRARA
jgi:chromosomal replication initiation ATPase DnaA